MVRKCKIHGWTDHAKRSEQNGFRCRKCASEAVTKRRKKVRRILVEEAGGACILCGYNRYLGSLDFHHIDPKQKNFGLSAKGFTRSLDKARIEASKCVLLCKNCHGEVEGGITLIPYDAMAA